MAWTATVIDKTNTCVSLVFTEDISGETYPITLPVPLGASSDWLDTIVLQMVAQLTARTTVAAGVVIGPINPTSPVPPVLTNGVYHAATSIINGSTSAQNLASIENPASATSDIIVNEIYITGVSAAVATAVFAYHVGRTTVTPSGGTTLTSQKESSLYPSTAAISRQTPTATAAAGDIWAGIAGPIITAVGKALSDTFKIDVSIRLAPSEGLLVRADANTANRRHNVTFKWTSL